MDWASTFETKQLPRTPHEILLIEDDPRFAHLFRAALGKESALDLAIANDPEEAMGLLARTPVNLIVADWAALSLMAEGKPINSVIPVIVLTYCDDSEMETAGLARLSDHYRVSGVVSKDQPIEGILEQIQVLFQNCSSDFTV